MRRTLAGLLVFVCSASVLVLEILAGRMMAPYVGVSLTTYTAAIGAVLAGISVGAWIGGRLADRVQDPRLLLGPAVLLGAAAALATSPAVRLLGTLLEGRDVVLQTLLLSTVVFVPPAVVLSAVHPIVAKILLTTTERAGTVVGWLSAVGTAGALCGTFVTGFVFVAAWSVPATSTVVAGCLAALGLLCVLWMRPARVLGATAVAALVLGAMLRAVVADGCDHYTTYYCVTIREPAPDVLELVLDDLRHSVVDLQHPATLHVGYAATIRDAVEVQTSGPVDAVHIGAGALAIPRWLTASRPGSSNVVLEIDEPLAELVSRLAPTDPATTTMRIGDARLTIRDLADGSADVVVGDAFASRSVPWHLTTVEFLDEVRRVLRPGGLYVMNLIETSSGRFTRSQVATLRQVFDQVAVVPRVGVDIDHLQGNVVLVASDRLDVEALATRTAARGAELDAEPDGRSWRDAPILTDDFAPVDQWLRP